MHIDEFENSVYCEYCRDYDISGNSNINKWLDDYNYAIEYKPELSNDYQDEYSW
jgi:hypothetical protein